jgi:succinate dehydrogenase / fumarate reductase flavoprotein subunit
MTNQCSVFRSQQGLENALTQIQQLKKNYLNIGLTNKSRIFNYELQEALELGNMLRVAEVIVYSALQRHESRGAHFHSDYPERNDKEWLKHTFVNETPTGLQVCYRPVVVDKFAPQRRSY